MPFKDNGCVILFLMGWLGFWTIFESINIYQLINSENLEKEGFKIYWIIGWTILGVIVFITFLWNIYGQEIVVIDEEFLKTFKVFGKHRISHRTYQMKSVRNLRVDEKSEYSTFTDAKSRSAFLAFSGGKIIFDWEGEKIIFGVGLYLNEARLIIEEIKKRGYYI